MNRRTTKRAGFTMLELVLGLAISAMVLACTAGLAFAVSHAWTKSEDINTVVTNGRNGLFQVADRIRNARAIGYSTPGVLLFWREDANGDCLIGENELSVMMVESGQLVEGRYVFGPNVSPSAIAANSAVVSKAEFTSSSLAGRLRQNTYYRAGPLAENVDSVNWMLDASPPASKLVQVSIRVTKDGLSQALVCGMALRAPLEVP